MTKRSNKAIERRRQRRVLNAGITDIPNMSGNKLSRIGYGAGINKKSFGDNKVDTNYHYYVWDPNFRQGEPPLDKYPDRRLSKTGFWIIRSIEQLDGLVELDHYVVTEYMKVGY